MEDKINKIPALIIAARNEKNELTAVQRIYLDCKTAGKNKFMEQPKLSKGIIEGSYGLIQKGMQGSRLYIAEGFETGASIAQADNKSTVLCSFGVSNMKNLSTIVKRFNAKEVIILGDNDGHLAKSQRAIETTTEAFVQDGLKARSIFPDQLPGKLKTDWNDIHLSKGIVDIQKQLLRNDIGTTLTSHIKPIELHNINMAQMKLMKLSDSQIISIRDNATTIDNSKNLNQLVATYNKNHSAIEKSNFLVLEKTVPIKMSRETEMDL